MGWLILAFLVSSPIFWIVLTVILFSVFPSLAEQSDEEIHAYLEKRRLQDEKDKARTAAFLKKYPPKI